jgi:hypothetical protein
MMSDIRLKRDIRKTGRTRKGYDWYEWKWTRRARKLVGNQPAFGVLANEVLRVDPGAVHVRKGYLAVDYSRVL